MKNRHLRYISFVSITMLLFFIGVNVASSYFTIKRTTEKTIVTQYLGIAETIAEDLDKETYKQFLQRPEKTREYEEIHRYLDNARKFSGALHVYTLKVDNPIIARTMIAGLPNGVREPKIGEVCTVPESKVRNAFQGIPFTTQVLKDPEYGRYVTVGVPIRDGKEQLGFIAMDVGVKDLHERTRGAIKENVSSLIFNGLYIIFLLGFFYMLQSWYKRTVSREVGETEVTYQSDFQSLLASVQPLRHDFLNHIQVLHGLNKLGKTEQARSYLDALAKDMRPIESIKLEVNNSGLAVLLETKRLAAENYTIKMNFEVAADSFQGIKTIDLIKLLSNIIDNAIEAAAELPEDTRRITVRCLSCRKGYLFEVINTGPVIEESLLKEIFTSGFSTKKEEKGKVRGQGLFIVKELVKKYKGTVSIQSENNETTVAIRIPKGEGGSNETVK